jgi:hypothetical protein
VVKNLWDINEPLPLKRRGVACTAYHHLGDRGIFSSTCLFGQSAPWECLWGQEMASGVERGRGGGSHGGEGRGGVVRCKKPGCFISFPLLWLLPSLLSSASVRFLFFSRLASKVLSRRACSRCRHFFMELFERRRTATRGRKMQAFAGKRNATVLAH